MEPVKTNVDGVDFIIRPLGVFDAFRTLAQLQKTVLPSLAQLMEGGADNFGRAIADLSERLTPEEFDVLCELLLFKHERIVFNTDGMETQKLTKDNAETAFKSMSGLLKVGEAVIRLNYADFFKTVKSLFGGVV